MSPELFESIIFDALRDSLLVFIFVFLVHLIISYFENSLANILVRRRKTGPIFGALFGLVPQCGTSVVGADLYIKKYISLGVLVSVFLSCSDEAFIAILASGSPKTIMILPLIGIKFVIGMFVGFIVDLVFRKQEINRVKEVTHDTCHVHDTENTELHEHLIHPLLHSLEIFAYVFVINFAIGLIIGFVGENQFVAFLDTNKYLTPLFSCIIGLIPNCASSLLLTELFLSGNLSFGALCGGLLVNSGLGMLVLIKNRRSAKNVFLVLGICLFVAITAGYAICLINGF